MMHRLRLKASRNIGLSATLSARALKLAGNSFRGFFHHHGTSPQRHGDKLSGAASGGPYDIDRIRRRNVVMGLQIASRAAGEFVQFLDLMPSIALNKSSAHATDPIPVQQPSRMNRLPSGYCAMGITPKLPRRKYIGRRVDKKVTDEREHFRKCPLCGGMIDLRDLGQVLEHEGPLPHPAEDQPQ
jgi:hypothetical protein